MLPEAGNVIDAIPEEEKNLFIEAVVYETEVPPNRNGQTGL